MNNSNREYWIGFVDQLSRDSELDEIIPSILKDLCLTFDFGCGFIYEGDHNKVFHLRNYFERYPNQHLQSKISLSGDLDTSLLELFKKDSSVCFLDINSCEDVLEQQFGNIFHAKSMVLIPVFSKNNKIMALVGLLDRRAKTAEEAEAVNFTRSILSILANYIKMQMYRKQAETSQAGLEGILDNLGIDVYVNDLETHEILYLNRSMAAPYGTQDELTGKICWQAIYNDKDAECEFCPRQKLLDENGNPTRAYSWDYQRPFDGAWFRVFSAAFPWVDGRMANVISSVDITENKRNEEIVRRMAEYDYLTRLPNRLALSKHLDVYESGEISSADSFWVIFFDLDGFKKINDTLGHKCGDDMLREVAARLQSLSSSSVQSFRYGGDEFVSILQKGDEQSLTEFLEGLKPLFAVPFDLDGHTIHLASSIGISHYPSDAQKTGNLIRKADQAMYFAKKNGKGHACAYNGGDFKILSTYRTPNEN